MRAKFKAFCGEEARLERNQNLTHQEKRSVKLVDLLRRKKAPMDTYEEVMTWFYESTGKISGDQGLDAMKYDYIGRKKLMKDLKERYNMSDKFAIKRPIVLPYSRQRVELICHNAWGCIESLLTDPRVTDDDYLFYDNDPTADVPDNFSFYADLNTGNAYRKAVKTYKQGIKNRVVLPVLFYIDGADTGSMKNMPVTAVKMALGIHTRK